MLFTCLFVVLCLYAVCSVIFANSQLDLRMQVFSEKQTQTELLAQAALNRCLREANETAGWETSHTVAAGTAWDPPPYQAAPMVIDSAAPAQGYGWIEKTADPNQVLVRGYCRLDGQCVLSSATCLRRPQSNAQVYMPQNQPGHLPQVYQFDRGTSNWSALPPVPSLLWRQTPPGPEVLRNSSPPGLGQPGFAQVAHFPLADDAGNFYETIYYSAADLASVADATRLDYLVRHPTGGSDWEILPPVPLEGYVNSLSGTPTLVATLSTDPDRQICLGAANKNQLIVGQRSQASGVVTLYRLDDPTQQGARYSLTADSMTPLAGATAWTALPYCPEANWTTSATLTVQANQAASKLTSLSMDKAANLYGLLDKPVNQQDVLVYYSAATGQWSFLHSPPSFAYGYDTSDRWTVQRIPEVPEKLVETAVDPDGNLYCVWRRTGFDIDSVFKFCPDGTTPAAGGFLAGTWKVLPAAPRSHYNRFGTLVQNPRATCPQFNSMAIDSTGCLYLKCSPFISYLTQSLDQVVYSWDCATGGEKIDKILPPIPEVITDPDYSQPTLYKQVNSGLVNSGSLQLAAGGIQSTTQVRIVPVSYFSQ